MPGNPAIAAMDEASALEREMKLASAIAPVAQDDAPVKYKKRGSSDAPGGGHDRDNFKSRAD